jgi:hypothetical protein
MLHHESIRGDNDGKQKCDERISAPASEFAVKGLIVRMKKEKCDERISAPLRRPR